MLKNKAYRFISAAGLSAAIALSSTGCHNLPGTPGQQGAAIGGVGGAVAGAAVGGSEHRLLGALIGGALGAGGGYLIGANKDRLTGRDHEHARKAVERAQTSPATPEQARAATTADLNADGFVTMDEVVAMRQAGLPDNVMLERLRASNQVFELTAEQERYLMDRGVSRHVVSEMPNINRALRDQYLGQQAPVGRPPAY